MRRRIHALISGIAMLVTAAMIVAATSLATEESVERGVAIAVTPMDLGSEAKQWAFGISLESETEELSDDLERSAVLIDAKGGRHAPVAWEGSPPGGRHRQGALLFEPVSPAPAAVELQIERPGEPAPRSFRWKLH